MTVLERWSGVSLTAHLTVEKLAAVLSYPIWNHVQQVIDRTRSYHEGLDAGLGMLRFLEDHRLDVAEKDFSEYGTRLCWFILRMLDKSDQWEEYLATWESLRKNTLFAVQYSRDSREWHGARIEPFVLREGDDTLDVHFLWCGLYRKEVIERKVERLRAGKWVGNMMHARREDLSEHELQRRIELIIKFAETHNQ